MNEMEKAAQRFRGKYIQYEVKKQKISKSSDLPSICFRYTQNYTSRKLGAYGDKP